MDWILKHADGDLEIDQDCDPAKDAWEEAMISHYEDRY